jgi:hypothetical protein
LAANLLDGQAISETSFEPEQQVLAMLILDLAANIAASKCFVFILHALLFQEAQQSGRQGPEA